MIRRSRRCSLFPCTTLFLSELQLWKSDSWFESRRHSKLELGSGEEKVNEREASLVVPEGSALIVVFGGVASTVKLREAGVWSVFPIAAVARTSRVWWPSASE